jgi:hypothetical protein
MNKLAVGAGRLTGMDGRFFGAPPLAIGSGPELDRFVGVIGTVGMGGTSKLDDVSGAVWLFRIEGGSRGGCFKSMSIASVDGKDVFAFAALAAAISSFGVLYPSSFAVDPAAISFKDLVREMRGAGCASDACALKVAGVA